MNILYLDLSSGFEDYSIEPARYGGGRIFAANAKQVLPNFKILGCEESFNNFNKKDNKDSKIVIERKALKQIISGDPLKDFVKNIDDFDIIVHHSAVTHINVNKPQAIWSLGFREQIHPLNKNILLHNSKYQETIFTTPNHIIYDVTTGVPMPKFKEYKKEDFIFSCSNHAPCFQSIKLAQTCKANEIKVIFAGPIAEGYPLLNEIDNKYVFYLGIIKQEEKIKYLKAARFHALLYAMQINNLPLSAIEALSYGCGIICTPSGFLKEIIKNGKNGFMVGNDGEFTQAWEDRLNVSQKFCYDTVKDRYSSEKMIDSFVKAFDHIVKNHKN